MSTTRRITIIGMLVAQALVLQFIERLIPNPIPVPGIKLGLANIVTLFSLVVFDFKATLSIILLRVVLGSLLLGTFLGAGLFMSLAGAVAAGCIMALLLRFLPDISLIGVSIAGSVAHCTGQLIIAALLINHSGIFYYLPIMLLLSVPTGFVTGLFSTKVIKYFKSNNIMGSSLLRFDMKQKSVNRSSHNSLY